MLKCKDIPFLKEVEQILSEVQKENIIDDTVEEEEENEENDDDEEPNEMDTN